tara:strand:+ start:1197 stop:1322 length:126 start_codon:yes stop_codon:yes gene_type:complete
MKRPGKMPGFFVNETPRNLGIRRGFFMPEFRMKQGEPGRMA